MMDESKKRSLLDSLDAAFSKGSSSSSVKRVKINKAQTLQRKSSKSKRPASGMIGGTSEKKKNDTSHLGTMLKDRIYGNISSNQLMKIYPNISSASGDMKASERQQILNAMLKQNLVCASSEEKKAKLIKANLHRKMLLLENVGVSKKKPTKCVSLFVPKMGKQKLLKQGVISSKKCTDISYKLASKQFEKWQKYVASITNDVLKGAFNEDALINTDRHGAKVKVTSGHNPAFVHLAGIIVQESVNTFTIVTENDSIKVLPKNGNTFSFELPKLNSIIEISGSRL